ncbi:hypothetical protein BJ508DRAFT_101 [Ascobolus immersus RN42]|uniref:Uncharacterized protein n=1 Tax=Ascobolus immersus RN42 TaxID=1160509 RepID=A0A3N4J1X0_ASCIM|nr:hypothetical protein BJ508DRAFT_101 [Ascobolus immersus RN42]
MTRIAAIARGTAEGCGFLCRLARTTRTLTTKSSTTSVRARRCQGEGIRFWNWTRGKNPCIKSTFIIMGIKTNRLTRTRNGHILATPTLTLITTRMMTRFWMIQRGGIQTVKMTAGRQAIPREETNLVRTIIVHQMTPREESSRARTTPVRRTIPREESNPVRAITALQMIPRKGSKIVRTIIMHRMTPRKGNNPTRTTLVRRMIPRKGNNPTRMTLARRMITKREIKPARTTLAYRMPPREGTNTARVEQLILPVVLRRMHPNSQMNHPPRLPRPIRPHRRQLMRPNSLRTKLALSRTIPREANIGPNPGQTPMTIQARLEAQTSLRLLPQ